ncbi:MAG TPA: hypothetical protein VK624_07385 [Steroidobacteraceae bacterium]|nr:hypothetical protein [Steroidobacteraceae bacterium]
MLAAFVDHLWQSLLFCSGVAVFAFLARASRAVLRLWLWRSAALKFLFPFALLHAVGAWNGFPVAHTADLPPPSLIAMADGLTPLAVPVRALQFHGASAWLLLALALLLSAACVRWSAARIMDEQRRAREEWERQERSVDDVLGYPGFVVSTLLTFCAFATVSAPLLGGALADRQRRHELLIANSLSLRSGQVVISEAAPGMGSRYRVVADAKGALIRNANLIDLVAIVYGIHRSTVWSEQMSTKSERDFWLISPRYDVRVIAPVRDPEDFDPYSLRQPVTRLLAKRFGLEIHLDNKCQPPCGNYGVAMSAEPL